MGAAKHSVFLEGTIPQAVSAAKEHKDPSLSFLRSLRSFAANFPRSLSSQPATWPALRPYPWESLASMQRRSLSVLLLFACLLAGAAAGEPPPNVLLILADDMGVGDLAAFNGGRNRTPNLDRLAAEGLVFDQAWSASPDRLSKGSTTTEGRLDCGIAIGSEAAGAGAFWAMPSGCQT